MARLLIIFLLALPGIVTAKPLVIFFEGQSNNALRAGAKDVDDRYRELPPGMRFFNMKTNEYESLPRFIGALNGFAWRLHDLRPGWKNRDIVLAHIAHPGSPINNWLVAHKYYIPMALASGKLPGDAEYALIWIQGENDRRYIKLAKYYGKRLKRLTKFWRRRIPGNWWFVQSEIPTKDYFSTRVNWHKQHNPRKRNAVVKVDGVELKPRGTHPTGPGYIELGKRLCDRWLWVSR